MRGDAKEAAKLDVLLKGIVHDHSTVSSDHTGTTTRGADDSLASLCLPGCPHAAWRRARLNSECFMVGTVKCNWQAAWSLPDRVCGRNAGKYKMVHGQPLEGIGWMMYVLRLAHTAEYTSKVLLAIADGFMELGRFAGDEGMCPRTRRGVAYSPSPTWQQTQSTTQQGHANKCRQQGASS